MILNDNNLKARRRKRQGSIFVAYYFGINIVFSCLTSSSETANATIASAARCTFHSLTFSHYFTPLGRLIDCHAVYLTNAQMTVVPSSA